MKQQCKRSPVKEGREVRSKKRQDPDSACGGRRRLPPLQMLRWSTSLPGKNFRKPQKIFMKNPQIPSVQPSPHLPSSPADARTQTRYCVKWKSSEAKLVLKITDNTTVSPSLALSRSLRTRGKRSNTHLYLVMSSVSSSRLTPPSTSTDSRL